MSLELDLEHYVIPPTLMFANSILVYAANMIETPRLLTHIEVFFSPEGSIITSQSKDGGVSSDRLAIVKEMEAMVVDLSTVY